MTGCVVDASVAAKWHLPEADEPYTEDAIALLTDHFAGRLEIVVPDVFWVECGNIFWKAARRGRISREHAQESIASLLELKIISLESKPLLEKTLALATRFDRTVYDSVYVQAAITTGLPLITADERLANALASRFPVRWLGAYDSGH